LLDSVNVLQAVQGRAAIQKVQQVAIDAPAVDVVTAPPPADAARTQLAGNRVAAFGATGTAFVLTEGGSGVSTAPQLVLSFTLAPGTTSGYTATPAGRCALDPAQVLGTRLGLIPDRSDRLYVADGALDGAPGGRGDGALELDSSRIPAAATGTAPACPVLRRLAATHPATAQPQPFASLALSPPFTATDGRAFPAGAFLAGVSVAGGLSILRTDLPAGQSALVPAPPFRPVWGKTAIAPLASGSFAVQLADGRVAPLVPGPLQADGSAGVPVPDLSQVLPGVHATPMEPLLPELSRFQDVAFFQQPLRCNGGPATSSPCQVVSVYGNNGYTAVSFGLLAGASAMDGTLYLVDVDKRRFVSDTRDGTAASSGTQASVSAVNTLFPAPNFGDPAPVVTLAAATADQATAGWVNAGVTRSELWRFIWHGQIPGLEQRGGALSRVAATGQLRFDLAATALAPWSGLLDVGDVVAFDAFARSDGSAPCAELQVENLSPLGREYRIDALGPTWLILATSTQGTSGTGGALAGFDPPDACLPIGATGEVRAAAGLGGKAWSIYEGTQWRGRIATGQLASFQEPRFDYPLDLVLDPAATSTLPLPGSGVGLAFTITGPDPTVAGSYLSVQTLSQQTPTHLADLTSPGGFGGPVIAYVSARNPTNLIFGALTGSNAVARLTPSLLGQTGSSIVYR
jgi:hypothetical protein